MNTFRHCECPSDAEMPYPRVCAHRGFNTVAPENSMPAWGAAVALGADEIEFDLWETADGVPVSIHDDTLDRVSNGRGKVREKTLAELEALDFGGGDPRFAGLRVVKFEDILRKFSRQAVMNIHVKAASSKEPFSRPFVRKIADLLAGYGCAGHAYFMTTPNVIEAAKEVAPEIPLCLSSGAFCQKLFIVERALEYGCRKVQMFTPFINQGMIDRAHGLGIRVNYFYSDRPEEARKLFEMGVDTLLTNDYWRIAQVRDAFVREKRR